MYHYSAPPPGYVQYEYTTSTSTSPSGSPAPEAYTYFVPPQYKSPPPKEYKRHARTQSYGTPKRPGGWHSPAEFPSPAHYARQPDFASPPAKYKEHVSSKGFSHARQSTKARRYSATADARGGGNWGGSYSHNEQFGHRGETMARPQRHAPVRIPPQKQPIIIDTSDSADDSPTYTHIKPRKPERPMPKQKKTNHFFFFSQAPRDDSQRKTSARRASTSRPTTSHKPTKPLDPPRQATAADALKNHIPAGYSLKNWDPDEAPILLLGSVFDANSLGKWIYDWTVYHHGPATPMSEVAGDLWLLLIKLAHKMKRADEILPKVEDDADYELVEDFLDGGDRLWQKMKKLLKQCEEFMWKAAKKEGEKDGGAKGAYKMGKNSGCEFVDSMFGRDRKLEDTEDVMQRIRLWNMRFDANCEDVLRHPRS